MYDTLLYFLAHTNTPSSLKANVLVVTRSSLPGQRRFGYTRNSLVIPEVTAGINHMLSLWE